MAKYVKRDGRWVHFQTGEPMLTEDQRKAPLAVPMIISDIPEYASPIDGRMITTRSERRDDLKRNNCVEYEPSLSPTGGKLKLRNPKIAAKMGVQVAEELR